MPLRQRIGLALVVLWAALGVLAGLNGWGWGFVFAFGWAAGERWMAYWKERRVQVVVDHFNASDSPFTKAEMDPFRDV